MKNHRGFDTRQCEVTTDDSENISCKLACFEKKSLDPMLFLLGLVRKNGNNLILHRSKFEKWLNKCKINARIDQIRQKSPTGSSMRDLATSKMVGIVL